MVRLYNGRTLESLRNDQHTPSVVADLIAHIEELQGKVGSLQFRFDGMCEVADEYKRVWEGAEAKLQAAERVVEAAKEYFRMMGTDYISDAALLMDAEVPVAQALAAHDKEQAP